MSYRNTLQADGRAGPGHRPLRQRQRTRSRRGQRERPQRRGPGAAAVAVLLGGVHGRGAGEAQGPQPQGSARHPLDVRVGADRGTGAGGGVGRRGTLGRNTQGEVVATSAMASPCTAMCAGFFAFQPARFMCAALFCCPFPGGALIPLLRPLMRQMVHLGKRQAWKPIRGDSLWT